MRAFTLDSFDTPPGLRENLPTPQLGPEQLLVRVQASSINPVDAFLAAGYLKTMAEHEFPVVLGRDYAGVVEQAGPAATGYAQGDEVYGWLLHANPTVHEGSWAELIAVPHDQSVARRPASIDVAQAGAAPLAALTALAAHDALELGEGATVLVVGASGGVGSFAVQLAGAAGAEVTAHVSGPSRVEQVRALGPASVVTEVGPDSGPFELVLDAVGGQVLVDAVHRLAPGGNVTAFGLASGERSELAFFDFAGAAPGGRLQGFFIYRTGEETFGDDLATLAGLVAEGRLEPQLGVVRDWTETPAAVDLLRGRQATGKVVLTRS